MKKEVQEIKFKNDTITQSHFDIVKYEDILKKKKPTDHSQFDHHKLSFFVLMFFTDGSGKHSINFNDHTFIEGSLFTLRKNNIHKFYRSNAKGILFVFTQKFISYQLNKVEASRIFLLFNELLASPKVQLSKTTYNEVLSLTRLIENEYYESDDNHSPLIIRNLLLSIISKLLRVKLIENDFINNSKHLSRFLDFQNLVETQCFKNRKVSFYADQMNITTKTLNNISQSIINKSAKSFINDVLITHTKRLIINSEKSLTEISYEVGFDEPTNFFKYFSKYAGLSPKHFRASH